VVKALVIGGRTGQLAPASGVKLGTKYRNNNRNQFFTPSFVRNTDDRLVNRIVIVDCRFNFGAAQVFSSAKNHVPRLVLDREAIGVNHSAERAAA
jgi:hypothetical protein